MSRPISHRVGAGSWAPPSLRSRRAMPACDLGATSDPVEQINATTATRPTCGVCAASELRATWTSKRAARL